MGAVKNAAPGLANISCLLRQIFFHHPCLLLPEGGIFLLRDGEHDTACQTQIKAAEISDIVRIDQIALMTAQEQVRIGFGQIDYLVEYLRALVRRM